MAEAAAAAAGPGPGRHVPALDGVRGLAILAVMVFHQTAIAPSTAVDRAYLWLAGHLQWGVDLFFVLSGYLITGILLGGRESPAYYRNFYARRTLRIVPLYYLVLAVGLLALPAFAHPRAAKWGHLGPAEQAWYWLFLSNWSLALGGVGTTNGLIDLSWTLSIEEQFYLAWPLVVRRLGRRRLLAACAALAASAPATRLAFAAAGAPPIWSHMMTPARWDALAVGAAIAALARGPGGPAGLARGARVAAAVGLPAVAALMALERSGPRGQAAMTVLGGSAVAACSGALVALAAGSGPVSRALSAAPLRALGVRSYALYLFHSPVQSALRERGFRPSDLPTLFGSALPGQAAFYAASTAAALALAWASGRFFEGPILRLKRFFPEAPPAGRPAAAG